MAVPTTPTALLLWMAGIVFLALMACVRGLITGKLVPRGTVDLLREKSKADDETIKTMLEQQAAMLAGMQEIKAAVTRAAGTDRSAA